MVNCRGCGRPIKFDNAVKSASGKAIPLEMNGDKHNCPANPYNQQRQTGSGGGQGTDSYKSTATVSATGLTKQDIEPLLGYEIDNNAVLRQMNEQLSEYDRKLDVIKAQVARLINQAYPNEQISPLDDDGDSSREEGDYPER